ncbi:MAG TPA: glycoside hydrolase family 25 protein [Thermoanaerobaculia bacterium]|nr:glycoside hydrolase family 25 protein [Thermoanaerobaculia bacterium]
MATIPGCDTVADISHWSGNVNLATAKGSGLSGIIQKATQGTTYVDPTLQTNAKKAKSAPLAFGTYHFGTNADGAAQANFYLKNVKGYSGLLVLDFESNSTPETSMTLAQAEAFVQTLQEATGIWPGVYCGSYAKQLLAATPSPILSNCWLWYAQYGPAPLIPQPSWKSWTMWQYTDGHSGIDTTPVSGIGACDRETFNGDAAGLTAFWNANAVPK